MNRVQLSFKGILAILILSLDVCAQTDIIIEGQLELQNQNHAVLPDHVLVRKPDSTVALAPVPNNLIPEPAEIILSEGIENYGAGYQPAIIYKHNNRVYLNGLIRKASGSFEQDDVICIL